MAKTAQAEAYPLKWSAPKVRKADTSLLLLPEPDVWIGRVGTYASGVMSEKQAEIHQGARQRVMGLLQEAGYPSAIVTSKPEPNRPVPATLMRR